MRKALLPGSVLLVVLAGVCGRGHANDNILGLPAPHAGSQPGTVLLHGGGRLTSDVFDRFIQLAGGRQAHIVLVPSAGYRLADYGTRQQFTDVLKRRFASWVRLAETGRIRSFEFLCTEDPNDSDDAAFVRPLASATGVWFSGGMQSRLNHLYIGPFPRQTRFQAALRDVLARGGVVGGTSAGMAALPRIMTLYQHRRRAGAPLSVVAAHGLGLFDEAIVEQHFDSRAGRLERFTGLLRDSARLDRLTGRRGAGEQMLGLAVEGSTALLLQGDHLAVLGAGNVHVFIKSPDDPTLTWHTLRSGSKARLRRAARDQVALVTER